MWKIKRSLLEDLLTASRNTYPNEFFALLSEKERKEVLEEFVVVPFRSGRDHADVFSHTLPFDAKVKGSFHSHPSSNFRPSRTDIRSFASFGNIHFIAGRPYVLESVGAFDVFGNPVKVEVVG